MKRKGGIDWKQGAILLAIVFLCLAMLTSFILYYVMVRRQISDQAARDLENTNRLSNSFLVSFFDSTFEKLDALSILCDPPAGGGENWRELLDRTDANGSRIEVADAEGTMYLANGKTRKVANEPFYRIAMAGEQNISEIDPAGYDGEDSIVLANPVVRGGETVGVVCLEIRTDTLGTLINADIEESEAYCFVVDSEGRYAARYGDFSAGDSFFELIERIEFRSGASVESVRADFESGKTGVCEFADPSASDGQTRILSYMPVYRGTYRTTWSTVAILDGQAYLATKGVLGSATTAVLTIASVSIALCLALGAYFVRQKHREGLRHRIDYLTGVYTREAARAELEVSFKSTGELKPYNCCFFLDVDDFKTVNDTRGHTEGDRILKNVAATLTRSVHSNDLVSRFGGDEFCVFLWNVASLEACGTVAKRLVETFREKSEVTISLGGTMIREGDTYDSVIHRADQALYRAKEAGKNGYALV